MGSIILKKIIHSRAPSILAASIYVSGMDKKYCRMRKVPKAVKVHKSMIAKWVSYKFSVRIITNWGIVTACDGIIMEARYKPNMKLRPFHCILENTYPPVEAENNCKIVMIDVSLIEFHIYIGKFSLSCAKFEKINLRGIK